MGEIDGLAMAQARSTAFSRRIRIRGRSFFAQKTLYPWLFLR